MMDSSVAWNSQDPSLSSASQDDFQQYLDLGMGSLSDSINFDFPYDGGQSNGQILQQDGGEAMENRMDTAMDVDVGPLGHKDIMMQGQMPPMTTATIHPTITRTNLDHRQSPSNSLVELDAQIQFLQQQRQHQERQLQEQQQRNFYAAQNRMVPPTPNSIEMHSANNQFYPQSGPQQQAMYERYQMRMKEQELAFTPLVSPAVTPLEAHFNIPEYTIPGAYFSPLSSPALHAQNEHRAIYDTRRSDPSAAASPNDVNVDSNSNFTNQGNLTTKATKKASKPRTPRAVRQSPIVKAQKRKCAGSATISTQQLADIVEPAAQGQPQTQSSSRSIASTDGSENESISPEHLSDMAPPPLPTPGSAGRSPFLRGQNGYTRVQQIVAGNSLSPATPASLMRLSKADQTSPALSNSGDGDDHAMEGFSLPEPANVSRPQFSRIDTQSDGQVTPTIESTSAPRNFQSLPSPALARPGSALASASPSINSVNTTNSTTRKTPQLFVRGSKKRGSVSSVQVSPALRPKISPSIKPLILGGSAVSDDTASLLLASKSNYQNILEGTHLPGVSYPTELSTNLTSKRTSHKIAEQGRRNRINSALQEIATLLPRGCSKDSGTEKGGSGSGDAGEEKKGGQSASSKASTVELAIEYIKQLQQEVADANKRAEDAEKALELKVSS